MEKTRTIISSGFIIVIIVVLLLLVSPITQKKEVKKPEVEASAGNTIQTLEMDLEEAYEEYEPADVKNNSAVPYLGGKFLLFNAVDRQLMLTLNNVTYEIEVPENEVYNLKNLDIVVYSTTENGYKILINVDNLSKTDKLIVYKDCVDLINGSKMNEFDYSNAIEQGVETETFAIAYENGKLSGVVDVEEGAKHDIGVAYRVIKDHEVYDTDKNLLITSLDDVEEWCEIPLQAYFSSELNEEMFSSHNYLVLRRTFGSGSIDISVSDAKYNEDKSYVDLFIHTDVPEVGTMDMSTSYVIIELDKNTTTYTIKKG